MSKTLVKEVRAAGGVLTMNDLKNYKVKFRPALKSKLDDMTLLSAPPPTAGPVLALTLNILDGKRTLWNFTVFSSIKLLDITPYAKREKTCFIHRDPEDAFLDHSQEPSQIATINHCFYSNHSKTIIKYFANNLNKHKHNIRSGHLVYLKAANLTSKSWENNSQVSALDNVEPDNPEEVAWTGSPSLKDSAIEAGTLARSVSDGITDKAKLKEMPLSGSCKTY